MTHQIFNLPPQQPLSAAGRILPGNKLYFYLTTTSTPADVYTTSALNVAHTQPVEADLAGRHDTVYLDPTVTYKLTVTDENDVLLYTVDPCNDVLLSQAMLGLYLYPRTSAEIAAGVTPTKYNKEPGDICRYGNNASPGSTDMSAALAQASLQSVSGTAVFSSELVHIASETEVARFNQPGVRTFTTTSVVTFAPGAVRAVLPQWWGITSDAVILTGGGTSCTDAFEAAIIAATEDGDGLIGIHPVEVPPGNYLVGNLVFPPAITFRGAGIHATNFVAETGATDKWFTDNGSASKCTIGGFAMYGRNLATLDEAGFDLGNDSTEFGTEGYIDDIWVRDLIAGVPGFSIRGNIGCGGRLIAQDTGGVQFVGTGGMLEQLVNMSPKGFDVSGTNYCTNIGDTRVDSVHIEAPATNTIPLLISANASIDTITVSFTNGRTHDHVVAIGADATSYRIGTIFYYFQSTPTPTITSGNIKLADGTFIGGNATNGSHSGEGGYQSGALNTGVLDGVKAQKFTSFKIRIVNTGGTIQHRIGCASDSSVAGSLHGTINSASASLTNTPTGADGSTAMAAGLKIGSANTNVIYFDTAAQVQADFAVTCCEIVANNTGTALTLIPQVVNININGTTRIRMAWSLQNATSAANVAWATALNDAADLIDVVFAGYLR